MQPILLLIVILLIILLGAILLLARENKQTKNKQQIRPRNDSAIDEMPGDLDEAMVWLEALAQKENKKRQNDSVNLLEWLTDIPEKDEDAFDNESEDDSANLPEWLIDISKKDKDTF